MSVYDSNIAIMAYAVLSERFNSEESVILSFRPLVEDLLASIADNMVQKVDLVNLYKDRYGYAIPPAILNEILLSLYSCNKIDFLKNDYIDIKKSAIEECSFLYKATLNRFKSSFSTFAKENDVTVKPKDTVQVFLDFMLKNAVDLNSFFNCLHEDSEINNEQEDDYSKIIIKYLMKIRLENTEIFELLNDIYYGIALSSVMKLDKAEISDLEHNNNITELIVDSNYVFRLLDLQTKYEHQTTIHTHKLAQDAGVEFYILPDTLEQIATTLTRFLDSINPNTISALSPYGDELFSGIHSAYIRNNFSKTELYELITNLQERLECEYSIKSWTKQIADVTESDYEIIESMQKFKPTTDDAGLIHDLKLVKTIDLIRPAYVADMSKAKCWVLTDDNKLMKWSASKYNKKRIPQCLTEAQLSTILWLRSPKEFNGQAFENVVFALLNQSLINKEQYRRISESIEKQKERFSGNPKKLDVMSLLFSTKCLSLNEIDSAADSDEELNRLFDEKMKQSQQYVESVNQVNENYRSENEHIKYMLTKSQNDVEISQRIISEQEKEIITSLQNSIATMELFLSDKQKQLNHLTSKRSREEAKIVTRLNVAILAIGATVIFAILYVNKKYSLMDVHGDLISAIISIICFIFFIVFGTNISDIIKKQKEKLAKTLLKKRMNKGKCENFDDAINHLQQEANALERSLEDVKCNLIEKQNGLKVE